MSKKNKTIPRKAKAFALWMSIPAILKDNKHIQKIKNMDLDGDEEDLLPQLMEATNLKEVAKVLDVSFDTVRYWKKNPKVKKLVEKYDLHCNALRFKNEVNYAFTQKTIRHADAARVKLWHQLYTGWEEKSKVGHEIDDEQVNRIQDKLKQIGNTQTVETFDVKKLQDAIQLDDRGADDGSWSEEE